MHIGRRVILPLLVLASLSICACSAPGPESNLDFKLVLELYSEAVREHGNSQAVADKAIRSFEVTDQPGKALDQLFAIIREHKPNRLQDYDRDRDTLFHVFLKGIALSKRMGKDEELVQTLRRHLWQLIHEEKRTPFVFQPIHILKTLSASYATPPSDNELALFLKLLEDEDAAHAARSSAAYCLRWVQEPHLRTRIRVVCEKLLPIYKEKYANNHIAKPEVFSGFVLRNLEGALVILTLEHIPDIQSLLAVYGRAKKEGGRSARTLMKGATRVFLEAAEEPEKAMSELFGVITSQKSPAGLRFEIIMGIGQSQRMRGDAKLEGRFRERILAIIHNEKDDPCVVGPMDAFMALSGRHQAPLSKHEQDSLFELLEDEGATPIARSTAAYCLSEVQEPTLRSKVEVVCEKLLPVYKEEYAGSMIHGRLELAIKNISVAETD